MMADVWSTSQNKTSHSLKIIINIICGNRNHATVLWELPIESTTKTKKETTLIDFNNLAKNIIRQNSETEKKQEQENRPICDHILAAKKNRANQLVPFRVFQPNKIDLDCGN